MELIKKIISLEGVKSRQGSLLPYVGMKKDTKGSFVLDPNGNWGKYPYDVNVNKCVGFENLSEFFISDNIIGKASYSHLIMKWRLFENFLKKATFYKKIRKKNQFVWSVFEPSFKEKVKIQIVSTQTFYTLSINDFQESKIGVLLDNSFDENGGILMLTFLLKFVGLFEVDTRYITVDNYVPEMLYYCEIDAQIDKLENMRNSGECCKTHEYEKYGGDDFLMYLKTKQNDRDKEFKYWVNALYKDGDKECPPNIYIPISLIGECKNIGVYTVVESKDEYDINGNIIESKDTQKPDYGKLKNEPLTTVTESKLINFKRRKKTQFLNTKTEKWEDMPIVFEDCQDDDYMFRVSPRYVIGNAINLSEKDGKYYGDVIYKIETIDDIYLEISYVIGGELEKTKETEKNADYPDLDNFRYVENSKTGVIYKERVKCERIDYTKNTLYKYKMLLLDKQVNILTKAMVKNISDALVIYDSENGDVDGTFYMDYPDNLTNYRVIMKDYNLGKTENLIQNIDEVVLDRGYSSAFELHYKLGEINSFEDMQNYQNNIFGL